MPQTMAKRAQQAIPFSEYVEKITSVHQEVLKTGIIEFTAKPNSPPLLKDRVARFMSWLQANSENLTNEFQREAPTNFQVGAVTEKQAQVLLGAYLSNKYLLSELGLQGQYGALVTSDKEGAGGSPFITIRVSSQSSTKNKNSQLTVRITKPPQIVFQWSSIEKQFTTNTASPFLVGMSAMHEFVHILPYTVLGKADEYLSEIATALVNRKLGIPELLETGKQFTLHGSRDPLATTKGFANAKTAQTKKQEYYQSEYLATWVAIWIDEYCKKNQTPLELMSLVSLGTGERMTIDVAFKDLQYVWGKTGGQFGSGELDAAAEVRAREFCRDSGIPQYHGQIKEIFKQLLQSKCSDTDEFIKALIKVMDQVFDVKPAPTDLPPGWGALQEISRTDKFADLHSTVPKKRSGNA